MPSPIVMFQIVTADPAASREFFSQLFDWDFTETDFTIAPLMIHPKGPMDFDPKGAFLPLPAGQAPYTAVFIRVADLWTTVAKAGELGASIVTPITELANGAHHAVIRTPEGHVIGIVQQ
jgi:predicted enzyme related to lactoylglutathione lyase